MLRKQNIATYYIGMQFVGMFFAVQPTQLIDSKLIIQNALILHILAILLFLLGNSFPALKISFRDHSEKCDFIVIKKAFYLYCKVLIIFGLIISVMQINSFLSISQYITLLIKNDSTLMDIRSESATGGLSGTLKIFAYAPLSIYLLIEGILKFYKTDEISSKKLKKIKYFALITSIIKGLLWMDRLTLLAILITNIYLQINKVRKKIILTFFIAAVGIIIANFISARRLNGYNIFDFIILYTKLGLVNFEMMIKTNVDYTLGLNTFFGPLIFIFKFLGHPILLKTNFHYVWNPAQYMNSYLYQDFGLFSLLIYVLFGWFVKNLDYWTSKNNKYYIILFFTFLFTFSTFWFVPIIRAVEFWLMLIIPIFSLQFLSSHSRNIEQ